MSGCADPPRNTRRLNILGCERHAIRNAVVRAVSERARDAETTRHVLPASHSPIVRALHRPLPVMLSFLAARSSAGGTTAGLLLRASFLRLRRHRELFILDLPENAEAIPNVRSSKRSRRCPFPACAAAARQYVKPLIERAKRILNEIISLRTSAVPENHRRHLACRLACRAPPF